MRLIARFARLAVLSAAALTLLGVLPAGAWAWANGPQYGEGFGTHDWVLYHANQSARQAGYDWVDWPTAQSATDDPDMVLRDFYHHVYDRTGEPYGDSPARVSELYQQAVGELRSGDRIAASRTLGLLSHYLSDSANPLHTDQTPAEKTMHSRYEDAVDNATGSPAESAALLAPHAAVPTTDAAELAERTAAAARGDYDALVSGFIADGNGASVQEITRRSLNAGVGSVADVIAGISNGAGVRAGAGEPSGAGEQPGAGVNPEAGGERGAGSATPVFISAGLLPGAMWCVVGMLLGGLLVAGLVAVLLWRRRRERSD